MKGIKIAIIVLIILLLVGGGTFAYLFLKTDLFLTNQQAFLKYLAQEDKVLKNYSKYNELQLVNEEAYSSDAIIELNTEMEEEELTAGANISTVKDRDNIFSEIAVNYQDEEFLKFKYLKEDDKHGIQFPGIKQYVVLENNNLKEFVKNLGLEDGETLEYIPNKITEIIPKELIKLTDNEKEQIKNIVINSLQKNISEERYSKEKSDNITVNGENIQATGYSLELTEKDILNFSKSILEEIKGNEVLLQLIENKIDYIMYAEEIDIFTGFIRTSFLSSLELIQESNQLINPIEQTNKNDLKIEITREKIEEALKEAIESLQEEIDEYNEEETAKTKISIYQNAGKTVKIKLELNEEQESYNGYNSDEETSISSNIIEIDNLKNEENKSHLLLTIKSYIDEELQQGQITQLIIENQEGTSILKEQIQDLKEEKILTTSEMKVSRVGQTIKAEGNVATDQEDSSVNIKYTNTIQIGNNNIEETLEDNEVVLNDLSLEKIEKIFDKINEVLEKEIQKKFPEFTFVEGNSTLELLERTEEAKNENKNRMLLDSVTLAYAQLNFDEMGTYIYNSADIEENGKLTKAIKDNYSGDIVITEKDGNLEVRDLNNNSAVIIELIDNKITRFSF